MKILFTGASSFTGYWFVRALYEAGHTVVSTYQRTRADYDGVRAHRIGALATCSEQVFECNFGSDRFQALIKSSSNWDMFCHHAADVTNYKSPDFDINSALKANTRNMSEVLALLAARGCNRLLLTGSVFEPGEGSGSEGLPGFSPYGVSKALTATVTRYHASRFDMHFGKFVIPNPFGPYEEPRFTAYLINTWAKGDVAAVNTPDYVRDNIHVSLLASAYANYSLNLPEVPGQSQINPSGYVESQGAFAQRFASQFRERVGAECGLELAPQSQFDEPRIRINTDPANMFVSDWNETRAWDEVVEYYSARFQKTPAVL